MTCAGALLAGCGNNPPPAQNAPPPAVEQAPPPVPVAPIKGTPLTATGPAPAYLSGKVDVALLLPLTGPTSALGHDMLNAAQLALLNLGGRNLALTPKDTGGTPDGAAKAATQAIGEGAKLIIGPLTAGEVAAVKPVAKDAGVNILTFSNSTQIAGDNVFLLGFMPQQEVARVLDYARSTGLDRVSVLAPASPYGQVAEDAAKQAAARDGFTIDGSHDFAANGSDLKAVVQGLGGPGFSSNALLVPVGGQQLHSVAVLLAGAQIGPPKVRLLGTGLWATPDLGNEPELVGGWYAAPQPDAAAKFTQDYTTVYGKPPALLASLAYDAVALAAVLDRSRGDDFSAAALTQPSGFLGVNGAFRLMPDGTNQRALAVLEVQQGGAHVVSPAPSGFASTAQATLQP
ncbi:MAG TPA: penicillin-binding protein activator [Stellaceae bacterium]|nr:penicillin-binding protein activator [Stellaceae bacterium]